MMIQKIIQELEGIPEEKLTELFYVVRFFRLGINKDTVQARTPGLLSGELGDAFFEPLPTEELQQWE